MLNLNTVEYRSVNTEAKVLDKFVTEQIVLDFIIILLIFHLVQGIKLSGYKTDGRFEIYDLDTVDDQKQKRGRFTECKVPRPIEKGRSSKQMVFVSSEQLPDYGLLYNYIYVLIERKTLKPRFSNSSLAV